MPGEVQASPCLRSLATIFLFFFLFSRGWNSWQNVQPGPEVQPPRKKWKMHSRWHESTFWEVRSSSTPGELWRAPCRLSRSCSLPCGRACVDGGSGELDVPASEAAPELGFAECSPMLEPWDPM